MSFLGLLMIIDRSSCNPFNLGGTLGETLSKGPCYLIGGLEGLPAYVGGIDALSLSLSLN